MARDASARSTPSFALAAAVLPLAATTLIQSSLKPYLASERPSGSSRGSGEGARPLDRAFRRARRERARRLAGDRGIRGPVPMGSSRV